MDKITTRIAAISAFTLLFSGQALAALPTLAWCNGCTDSQKKNKAAEYPIGTTVYVGDVTNRSQKGFFIDQGWTETQPTQPYAKPTPFTPAPPQSDVISAMMEFYNITPAGWSKAIDYNYPVSNINVYKVVNPGPNQNNLTDWVGRQPYTQSLEVRAGILAIGSTFTPAKSSELPKTTFEIEFTDGSTITVEADYSGRTPRYKVKLNTGRDSHNNDVLSTPDGMGHGHEFDFSGPGNPSDYANWLYQMGTFLHYDVPVSPGSFWACTNSPAGLHCVHPY